LKTGLLEEAASLLRQAQQQYPGDFWIHLTLAQVRMHGPSQRDTEEAAVYYRMAVALRPHHSLTHLCLGLALARLGHLPEAESCFRRARSLNPNHLAPIQALAQLRL